MIYVDPDTDAGTVVRITRAPKGTKPEWDDFYDDITEGWIKFLQRKVHATKPIRHQSIPNGHKVVGSWCSPPTDCPSMPTPSLRSAGMCGGTR
ncbi:hypothetical protein [Antrihabitans stalactiti]|uniref:hypothetical protein n=1 Tax=Antrihabitans stalactiti TaxID=2584121 RepID=UPI001F113B8E|nr:hypothetical protein [Antrihabitans stalactiti]